MPAGLYQELTADLIAEEHVAEGLLKDLRAQGEMRRVLLFRAAEARELLPGEQQAALNIPDLDNKLLAGVRSPARPLTDADFDRIRNRTRRKLKQLEAA